MSMEKEVKTTLWIEDGAVRLEADGNDFEGDVAKWKDAFYQLWRYQMTWDFAYSIRVSERRETGVYVSLLIKKAYTKQVKKLLADLGYRKISEWGEHVGIVQTYDIDVPEAEDMFEVFAE